MNLVGYPGMWATAVATKMVEYPIYRAVRQVIGRDCSQKILSPSIHIVVGNFCQQSLPITYRTAQ